MFLDLGCGKKEFRQHSAEIEFNVLAKNVLRIDNLGGDDIDVSADIIDFLFKSRGNSYEGALLSHVIEHFTVKDQINILELCHDVLKNGSKVIIFYPHFSSAIAKTHLTHNKLIGYNTFDNFLKDSQEKYSVCIFDIEKKIIFGRAFKFLEGFFNNHPEFYEQYCSSFIPAWEIKFVMVIKK